MEEVQNCCLAAKDVPNLQFDIWQKLEEKGESAVKEQMWWKS